MKTEFPFTNVDVPKILREFKLPGLDVDTMVQAQRKNIEALTEANRLAAQGFQAVAKRQAEILRDTFQQFSETARGAMSASSPEANAARQAEAAKHALERALGNMRELAELATKASNEAFDRVNSRVMESIDELKVLLTKGKK